MDNNLILENNNKYNKGFDNYIIKVDNYSFKWRDYSCRFDSLLFLLKYKLVNLFILYKYDTKNIFKKPHRFL